MSELFLEWLWDIDSILAAIAFLLTCATIATVLTQKAAETAHRKRIRQIHQSLKRLVGVKGGELGPSILPLARGLSEAELLDMEKRPEFHLSTELEGPLNDALYSSGRIASLIKTAEEAAGKWKRIEAVICLGYLKPPLPADTFLGCLQDSDEDVSYYAMLALWRLGTSRAASILMEDLVRRPSRAQKIASLLETFSLPLAEMLERYLSNPQPHARFWALKLLSKSKTPPAYEAVRPLAEDASADVRAAACECLGSLGDPRAVPVLSARQSDQQWFVRMHAARALFKLTGEERYRALALEPK